jgi:ABC-type lipoprotein release transport system permease subunit
MKLSLWIATRYLWASHTHKLVKAIGLLSGIGLLLASTAMVLVLSAFNGIQDVLQTSQIIFESPLRIASQTQKTFLLPDSLVQYLNQHPFIQTWSKSVEETVFLSFKDRTTLGTLKSLDSAYLAKSQFDNVVLKGTLYGEKQTETQVFVGIQVAANLGFFLSDLPLQIAILGKNVQDKHSLRKAVHKEWVFGQGIFSTQSRYDHYVLVDCASLQTWLGYGENQTEWVHIQVAKKHIQRVKKDLEEFIGDANLVVQDWQLQNPLMQSMQKAEKYMAVAILSAILFLMALALLSALGILFLEKQKDHQILYRLGLLHPKIGLIYLFLATLVTGIAGFLGTFLGIVMVYVQNTFGILRMDGGLVSFFPMQIALADIFLVLFLVLLVGFLSGLLPFLYYLRKNNKT